ncbi:glycosyltransferase [Eubacteriaceae bacterium ES3]|nr:glycosyltransferase [Eubacteriaceae bacterium ES3]
MKLAYVILHYLAGKDTIECAKSILSATIESEHETIIIIVDNGSTNESYFEIQKAFTCNKQVILLHSDENIGFARGNNIGFCYAKRTYQADFIVQLNNDTIVRQKDFNEVIIRKFDEKQYSVLGPDIMTADGFHQNPGSKQTWNYKELMLYVIKKRVRIALSYIHMDFLLSKAIESVKEIYHVESCTGDVLNTILHGACFVFSPLFISQFDGLYEETFLYWEEDILKLQADFYGFVMLYSSELYIYHKEDIATNMVKGSTDIKTRRKYKRLIESAKVYRNLKRNLMLKKKLNNEVD